jgi:uncharacterized protein (DUF2141 family)
MMPPRGLDASPPRLLRRGLVALCLAAIAGVPPAGAADQSAAACQAGAAAPIRLLVTATGARRVAGNITFTLYGERRTAFLAHHGSIALTRVTLTGRSAEGCFALSAPGTYAVAVYHDENDNHRFDRTLLGLPAEGYGFSNDAPTPFGLPSFNAARITVQPGDNRITVRIRY